MSFSGKHVRPRDTESRDLMQRQAWANVPDLQMLIGGWCFSQARSINANGLAR